MRALFQGGVGRKGMALMMAIFSLIILGVLAAGFMASSVTEYKMSFNAQESMLSGQLSEAGLAYGYQWLHNQDPAPCQAGGGIPLGSISVASCGTTNPVIYADAANDCSEGGFDCSDIGGDDRTWKYTIHADGTTAHGTQGAAEMDVRVGYDNSACYAQFFDRCQDWYWDYDVVKGPVHCNGQIKIYNQEPPPWIGARFWGPVTQHHNSFRKYTNGPDACGDAPECYATFYEGYETGVDKIDYPPDFGNAVDGIDPTYVWTKNTRILLHADGTMAVWNHAVADSTVLPIPTNPGVCHVEFTAGEGDADVSGTLNGRLSIVADRNIIIRDDILLADDPRFNPTSDDILGLVAAFKRDGDIIISDVVPGFPDGVDGDRIIQAYLIALRSDGKVLVEDLHHRSREGILYTYGGWVVATIVATEVGGWPPLRGYGTDTEQDKRGCRCPPPGFPPLKDHNQPITKVSKCEGSWREVY